MLVLKKIANKLLQCFIPAFVVQVTVLLSHYFQNQSSWSINKW